MSKWIVITSIQEPTLEIKDWCDKEGWELCVVGDEKTPDKAYFEDEYFNCHYLSFAKQHELFPAFAQALPKNHYCRKNIGYLYAMQNGADVIMDTDDDNLSKENWDNILKQPEVMREVCKNSIEEEQSRFHEYVNAYSYFTYQHIWPRGLPLNYIDNKLSARPCHNYNDVKVWQGLVDGDPDVDAIFRLTSPLNKECDFQFDDYRPIVLGENVYCPFNSQNTIWRKEAFPLMYLPGTVSFRFTDILRSYFAQVCLRHANYKVGFTTSTAVQNRNAHDLMRDFEDEQTCYNDTEAIVKLLHNLRDELHPKYIEGGLGFLLQHYYFKLFKNYGNSHEENLVMAWNKVLYENSIRCSV